MGVNLLLGKVDADVEEVDLPDGERAVLRIVNASTAVVPVIENGKITGLEIRCHVEANLAQGSLGGQKEAAQQALAQLEQARLQAALELAQTLDADYLGLIPRAQLRAPWKKEALAQISSLRSLRLEAKVEASLQRGYFADG